MDYIRCSVNIRAYVQRDQLVENLSECVMLFNYMQMSVNAQVISTISSLDTNEGSVIKDNTLNLDLQALGGSIKIAGEKQGRNDKIIIEKNGEEREVKFKKLDGYLKDGWKVK
jgi:preprotein translocase subunit SecA